ncbi:Magnesium and cobalt transport protein CorA [Marinobacterium lacunae]|uniref:Magnesium and cobalt transport protein CorA n=1 Tax=Marinobacterium lacunae TaxID=1232683 RepID=A0A081G1S2_9GAMM|nr:zinc transporter ZntB [Marinobacterium lacunae]KEA64727.1 Magnesium and cobalt transport protein CorA [Marinobacterium lacunae]
MTDPAEPLHALLLDGQGGARDLTGDEIRSWQPDQGVLWLHLDYSEPSAQQWLNEESGLPEVVIEALLTENTRPRATQVGDGLLIALRGVNLNPGADPDDMVSVRLYATPYLIISTRKRRLQSVTGLAADCRNGEGPRDVAELLIELSDRLVQRMGDVVEETEEALSELELEILEQQNASVRQSLSALRRQTIRLRRYFGPQRDAFNQLQSERLTWISADQKLLLREVSDRLLRHIEDLDMIRERAGMAQEEMISQLSDQLNQRMYILSLIAAIFLPLGFLTGLLGINVGGIPGADNPYAFELFSILLCILVALQLWLFKQRRWL